MSAINQINPKCPVCSGSEIKFLCQSDRHEILRCSSCACDFVWPVPDKKALKAYYDGESYFQGSTKGSYTNYDMDTEAVLSLFGNFLLTFPDVVGKKILDIGCAYGTQLAVAAERGWEAWGVELSDHAREVAISRHGERIQVVEDIGSLPKLEFDLVVMLDVLEHLPNPYEIFIELLSQGIIGKKTQLVITTPNARSVDALDNPAGWAYRHPPAHLVYFSAKSLKKMIAKLGGRGGSVQGVYNLENRESRDFSDEIDAFNHGIKNYAGLMCVVQGFDISMSRLLVLKKLYQCEERVGGGLYGSLLEQEIDKLKAINYLKESWVVHLEEEVVLLSNRCNVKESLITHLEDENSNLHNEIDNIRNSMSWKVTKPLRNVKMFLKGMRSISSNASSHGIECYQVQILNALQDNRPRVVHVIGNFVTGGSSRLVVDLFEHLGHLYEQEVVTQFNPSPPNYIGIPIHEFRGIQSYRAFIAYLRKFQPKLIHVHYWGSVDKIWYSRIIKAAHAFGCNGFAASYWCSEVFFH